MRSRRNTDNEFYPGCEIIRVCARRTKDNQAQRKEVFVRISMLTPHAPALPDSYPQSLWSESLRSFHRREGAVKIQHPSVVSAP